MCQVAFEKLLAGIRIDLHHSRIHHPQTCGKVERFHQTEKKWLDAHDPAPSLIGLQHLLDTFTEIYNTAPPSHRPTHACHRHRCPPESHAGR